MSHFAQDQEGVSPQAGKNLTLTPRWGKKGRFEIILLLYHKPYMVGNALSTYGKFKAGPN